MISELSIGPRGSEEASLLADFPSAPKAWALLSHCRDTRYAMSPSFAPVSLKALRSVSIVLICWSIGGISACPSS